MSFKKQPTNRSRGGVLIKLQPNINLPLKGHREDQKKATVALDLPLEMLMETLGHFKTFPEKYRHDWFYGQTMPLDYLERTDVLRSLSQTCRQWRQWFLPILWEMLTVGPSHSELRHTEPHRVLGERLLWQNAFVQQNPQLASNVRTVSVCLGNYDTNNVLSAFVEMIKLLQNLYTIQIIWMDHEITAVLPRELQGHVFPQRIFASRDDFDSFKALERLHSITISHIDLTRSMWNYQMQNGRFEDAVRGSERALRDGKSTPSPKTLFLQTFDYRKIVNIVHSTSHHE
ncbi:hypothetical protein CVT24_010513 [Panaeolus cyanescens]|uniref:Uncharacterized protein n=1 Tax=Panaeolus cyanescens TaxID=181874 RepID=A0A409YVX3_9AGAR|nr:hypothetical protein CVT24_010513 [Panaeolus cyanescens]